MDGAATRFGLSITRMFDCYALVLASVLVLPSLAHAQSGTASSPTDQTLSQSYPAPVRNMPLQPRVDVGGRVGTERSIGVTEIWLPLTQSAKADKVVYTDIRYMGDDESNQEGNLGVGYRAIADDISGSGGEAIIGAHGWIDKRRTERGSNFYQLTGGVEYLKEDWDVKINAYVPLNKKKDYVTPNAGNANPYMAGTGLFVDTNGQITEEAQPGGDIEIGYRIPAFEQAIDAIRVYGGGYAFIGDRTDDVVGGRIRASVDINPLINVGARFQHDEPRGSQGFIEATLRFPFTAKKRFQSQSLKARMDESPERDIDIVTGSTIDTGLRKPVINTDSKQIQRVIHVDNSTASGGNGSLENPYNTLAAAEVVMRDHDTIYIHAGNNTASGMDQGLTVDRNNVQVIGTGSDFIYDRDRFTVRRAGQNPADGTLIAAATTAPVITNIQTVVSDYTGNGILIRGRDTIVSGVNISNATGRGVYALADGTDIGNVTISNIIASGTNGNIRLAATNGGMVNEAMLDRTVNSVIVRADTGGRINNATLQDSIGPIQVQVRAESSVGDIAVKRVTIENSGSHGMTINADGTNAAIGNVLVEDSTVTSSASEGIWVYATTGGMIDTITLRGNAANNSLNATTGSGIRIQSWTDSMINTVLLDGNTTNGNNSQGVHVTIGTRGTLNDLTIRNQTANGNTQSGVYLANGGATARLLKGDISYVTATGNNQNGIHFNQTSSSGPFENIMLSHNDFINNNANGIYLQKGSGSVVQGVDFGEGAYNGIGRNRIFGNGNRDIRLNYIGGAETVAARQNWWGNVNGLQSGRVQVNGSSAVDASGYLSADPRP